jgi:hypothetical protein
MKNFLVLLGIFFFVYPTHAQPIFTTEWKKLVPSADLPSSVKCMNSNNNLDLFLYKGRYYVAFRTAPTHFASEKTRMYIISSADFQNWKLEKEFMLNADMREQDL